MPADGARPRPSRAPLLLAAGLVAADQAAKAWALAALRPGEALAVLPGWFQLRLILNRGGLFGVLRGLADPWRAALFTGLPLLASVGLCWYLLRPGPARLRWGLAMILGGAVGNLADRVRLGHVVDFLDVYFRQYHWPAFNLADSAICVGVGLILLDAFRGPAAGGPDGPPRQA